MANIGIFQVAQPIWGSSVDVLHISAKSGDLLMLARYLERGPGHHLDRQPTDMLPLEWR
jgi:hypothetical protein